MSRKKLRSVTLGGKVTTLLTHQTSDYAAISHNLISDTDLAALNELRGYLVQLVRPVEAVSFELQARAYHNFYNLVLSTHTLDSRNLRITVLNRQALLETKPLYFVGFFGQKRPQIDPELQYKIARLDKGLLRNLERFPSILSYCSMELPDRYNYVNLVLFDQLAEIERWKERNPLHRVASQGASPGYYEAVRIHMGTLNSGLASSFTPMLTKYYDFSTVSF